MLYNVMNRSFVLMRSNWLVGQVRELTQRLEPSHIIVGLATELDIFYLFSVAEISDLLAKAEDHTPTHVALALDQHEAASILDALDEEMIAPNKAVVVEEGRVIGFVDAGAPPPPVTKSRGFEPLTGVLKPIARALVTNFPPTVVIGDTNLLAVILSLDISTGQFVYPFEPGSIVDVRVEALRCFELLELSAGEIVVTDAAESPRLQFKLKATKLGLGVIRICVGANGYSLGSVMLQANVVDSSAQLLGEPPLPRQQPLPIIEGRAPDLSLIIGERRIENEPCLILKLKTREQFILPRLEQDFPPIRLRLKPVQYFHEFFEEIENLPYGNDQERRAAQQCLEAKGCDLYKDLFPEPLREVLWAVRERIQSVQIESDESWIPWELCRFLSRDEKGKIKSGPFFCETFDVTRWLPKYSSKSVLSLRRIALVVPTISGLRYAKDEREYMESLANSGRIVKPIPATLEDILPELKRGECDVWHFSCHASAVDKNPDRAELELDSGAPLRPELLGGELENLGLAKPLVFLNACQSGHSGLSLTGIGGWPDRFLRAASDATHLDYGAAAFVGTYWATDDEAAYTFAKTFYTALLEDKRTIGEAVRSARLAIRPRGDPTWLAYTVFAHPLAKVE